MKNEQYGQAAAWRTMQNFEENLLAKGIIIHHFPPINFFNEHALSWILIKRKQPVMLVALLRYPNSTSWLLIREP